MLTLLKGYEKRYHNVTRTLRKGEKMEKRKYSIQELADILGISAAAVRKKITTDENNPQMKRYKKRYEVVSEEVDGRLITLICLNNIELEEEKRVSKINKIKYTSENTLQETLHEGIYEAEYVENTSEYSESMKNSGQLSMNDFMEFTERYNNRLETYLERIVKAESQQLLLEDKASREGLYLKEIEEARAEAKQARNVLSNVVKGFVLAMLLMVVLVGVTGGFLVYKLMNPIVIEKEVVVEKPVIERVEVPVYRAKR